MTPADLAWLRTPDAVRARAHEMLALAEAGLLPHFTLHPERLPEAAGLVAAVTLEAYPALAIPHHARWRHFAAGGIDRWGALARRIPDDAARARARVDLCVVSVLLDAGAGDAWAFEEDGRRIARSEGLAVASLHAFRAGLFSSDPRQPLRVDAAGLAALAPDRLGAAFQVSARNPLLGLEGRVSLMHGLARAIGARPEMFGADPPRPGGLFDYLAGSPVAPHAPPLPPPAGGGYFSRHPPSRVGGGAGGGSVPAAAILGAVLDGLAPAWPARTVIDGISLGDVWPHPSLPGRPIPFHKLSQWLSYSLIEVLEDAGIAVTGIGALTGLPEYRNGGLFLDTGVLALRDPTDAGRVHAVGSPLVVAWRALTVALLDRIAPLVRDRLGKNEADLPLSRILEGGTWAAGRRIAARMRSGGGPPLKVESDGTIF